MFKKRALMYAKALAFLLIGAILIIPWMIMHPKLVWEQAKKDWNKKYE